MRARWSPEGPPREEKQCARRRLERDRRGPTAKPRGWQDRCVRRGAHESAQPAGFRAGERYAEEALPRPTSRRRTSMDRARLLTVQRAYEGSHLVDRVGSGAVSASTTQCVPLFPPLGPDESRSLVSALKPMESSTSSIASGEMALASSSQ